MLDTLTDLKNNKAKRTKTQPARGNAAERLKKFLVGLGKTRHRELLHFGFKRDKAELDM
jgi:nucleolar MIF4G domain-containing protein 1